MESLLTSLPLELLCHVICFLGPREVVQLRSVCKQFRELSFDSVIWKTLYANATVPRPPGPYLSQTTRFLEHTLVQSARLADSWIKQPIQDVSSTHIRLAGPPMGHPRIICGRWLITFESYTQIVFHDIETRSKQVLWEDRGLITSWDACSVTTPRGQLIYVVFRESTGVQWRAPWRLLEFRVDGESGQLCDPVSLHIPARNSAGSVCLVSGNAPFLYLSGEHLIFDTRTRCFYAFPEFIPGVDGVRNHLNMLSPQAVLLTNTHMIVLSHRFRAVEPTPEVDSTLLQAFSLPSEPRPASSHGTGVLHLTHEGIVHDDISNVSLIRNSTNDPVSGTTHLRFVYARAEGNTLCFPCLDISLSHSDTETVLPMTIERYHVFSVPGGMYDCSIGAGGYYIQASDDGHARGFCRTRTDDDDDDDEEEQVDRIMMSMTKFSIDATHDKCVAVVGEPSPPRWGHIDDLPRFSMLSFDGIMGKLCYLRSGSGHHWRSQGYVDAVVVDIK